VRRRCWEALRDEVLSAEATTEAVRG
jgi:hypothetical protein